MLMKYIDEMICWELKALRTNRMKFVLQVAAGNLVMGIVFENDRYRNRFHFWLGILDFKMATKLFL